MTSLLDTLDPEVRQVLLEIARDEESTLFRIRAGHPNVDPLADVPVASTTTAGWKAAEKHLLRAYREEVWMLLHKAHRVRIGQDDRAEALTPVRRTMSPGESAGKQVRTRARVLAGSAVRERVSGIEVLDALAAESGLNEIGIDAISYAASRLIDCDSTRLLVATSANVLGQHSRALELAAPIARDAVRADLRGSALTIAGLALWMMDRPHEAISHYESACRALPGNATPAVSLLMTSLETNKPDRFLEAARYAEATLDGDEDQVAELVRQYRTRFSDPKPLPIAGNIMTKLGPMARAIIHGIYQQEG